MITEHIKISSSGEGMNETLAFADKLAASRGLMKKQAFHLRLLVEEMFSMVRSITGGVDAYFWIESNNRDFEIHLKSNKITLDYAKRKELLSVSTEGRNVASRGIMEKIRELVEAGLYGMEESFNLQAEYGTGMFSSYGMMQLDQGISDAVYLWSMEKYKKEVDINREENSEADTAWDELEKSIIANIADDVQVGVRRGNFEIIVKKKF